MTDYNAYVSGYAYLQVPFAPRQLLHAASLQFCHPDTQEELCLTGTAV